MKQRLKDLLVPYGAAEGDIEQSVAFSSSRFAARLNAGLLLLAFVVCTLVAASIWSSRSQYDARAVTTASNVSKLLMHDLDATFDKVDLAVLSIKEEVERQLASGGIDGPSLESHIHLQLIRQSDVVALRATDENGRIRYGTGIGTNTGLSSESRSFFQKLKADPTLGLVISEPIIGQISGKWSIVLARRISKPDASFGGVVFGVLLLEDFQKRFSTVDLGPHGAVSLRDLELGTVVRHPEPANIGSAVGNRTFSKEWPEELKRNPTSGTYFAVGLDGRNRALAYNRVTDYPFYIIAGLFPDDYLGPWKEELQRMLTGLALLIALSYFFSRMLRNAWKGREADSKRLLDLTSSALLRSEDRLQLALARANMGLWTFIPSNGKSSATACAKALHDLSPDDDADLNGMLRQVVAEDRPRVEAGVKAAIDSIPSEIEFRLHLADGTDRWVAWTIRWVPGGAGHQGNVVVLIRDISATKQLQHRLVQEQQRKDEFIAILSHELRGPLAPIRSSFEVIRRTQSGDSVKRALTIIDRQFGHLQRLIDDLLDVSRISQGKMRLQRERLNLVKVLESALEASKPLLDAAAHRFTMAIPDEPVFVQGDLTRLAQVISNLLNNAARYTPAGGNVSLTVSEEEDDVIIEVKDDGAGISREALPRIFELFNQGDRMLVDGREGLGLGLSLVRQLVELHGGTVQAASKGPGHGSTFKVSLPRASVEEQVLRNTEVGLEPKFVRSDLAPDRRRA